MNADDKKLLRKFINERADRTRATLRRTLDRRIKAVHEPLAVRSLSPEQLDALGDFNEQLNALADAMNALVALDLMPRHPRPDRWRISTSYTTRPLFNAADGLDCDACLKTFGDDSTIHRLAVLRQADEAALRAEHAEALKRLDATVDDALLDLLSKDLPGIREELARLNTAFAQVTAAFGATPADLEP